MKKVNIIAVILGVASFVWAGDLKTKSGYVFKDFALVGSAPSGIRVMHSGYTDPKLKKHPSGIAVVAVKEFPDDLSEDMKLLVKKYEDGIPEAKKKAEERRKKRLAQQKKNAAASKAQAAREKKSAAIIKQNAEANKKLYSKVREKTKSSDSKKFDSK